MGKGGTFLDGKIYDVTIIGGGPVGLFAAFYGGMRQLKVKIIESLPQLGGQLTALYPDKYIYDVAGFPKIKAQELVDQLINQAFQFNHEVVLGEKVETLTKLDGIFQLETDKNVHLSRTVLITAGVGAFQPRKLNIQGAEKYENNNLHYYVKEVKRFHNKNVCILGGGDSAVDWALMLEPVAKSVSIIHRRNEFRAHESSVEQLKNANICIYTPYVVSNVCGNDSEIESIEIKHIKTEEKMKVELDELICNYGFISSLGPIKNWGIEIDKNSIVTDSTMQTSVEGVYAAGDIVTYNGKVKLIATGFGDAATAISSIKAYINPNARKQPQHSTSIFEKIVVS